MYITYSLLLGLALVGGSVVLLLQQEGLFMVWVALELNLIGFLLSGLGSGESSSSLMKYFLIQSVGSGLILINMFLYDKMGELAVTFLILATMMKAGAAPLHLWFVYIVQRSKWGMVIILSTVQKLGPLLVLSMLNMDLTFWALSAVVFGLIGSLLAQSFKLLVGYSSIFNFAWPLMILPEPSLWLMFLGVYGISLIGLTQRAWSSLDTCFSAVSVVWLSHFSAICTVLGGLSVSGFPPTPGFYMKLWAGYVALMLKETLVLVTVVVSTLGMLSVYIKAMMDTAEVKGIGTGRELESALFLGAGVALMSLLMGLTA